MDNIAEFYNHHRFESAAERLECIDSLLADNKYLFRVAGRVEGGVSGVNPSPGVADTYMILMNIWNTLLQSYQQWVNNNILATVKHHIQQAENPMPAVVIIVEAVQVDNTIHLHYLAA
jgi:hypothetical protein